MLQTLLEIAQGMEYMHYDLNLVHGDLKGRNASAPSLPLTPAFTSSAFLFFSAAAAAAASSACEALDWVGSCMGSPEDGGKAGMRAGRMGNLMLPACTSF